MSKIGQGYLFAFCDPQIGDEGEYIGFAVVEKKFFEENGHMDSVHFTDVHGDMPFQEDMESMFIVETAEMSEEQVRDKLIALGFEESAEFAEILS